jgi:hypothetical protein
MADGRLPTVNPETRESRNGLIKSSSITKSPACNGMIAEPINPFFMLSFFDLKIGFE